jgi:hypothetical protein
MQSMNASVTIVQELELGEHTVLLMSGQSISITDHSGEDSHADTVMRLTSEETYRLCVTLQALFQ